MSQRRFEDALIPNPDAVVALADTHPAILQGLPMFETMMVSADQSPRLLISGHNSRKIGKVVTKGVWKGFPIYTLTLAERVTCPTSCHLWAICYGNAMPFARRHMPGADLEAKLEQELAGLATAHPKGFVVRLHVLGDFYSVEYVNLWRRMIETHKMLHVYGYTARMMDIKHPAIGTAISDVVTAYPNRFCIRASDTKSYSGAAVVIDRIPDGPVVAEGQVCPAEREATACCATCGLCWEPAARNKTIVFIRHGMGSRKNDVVASAAGRVDDRGLRQVRALANIAKLAGSVRNAPPILLWVKPDELLVDESYQRNLSRKSIQLITKIVQNWNWTHLKPPIVVKDEDSNEFFVIDGQHTAIAAATHPKIDKIPIMVVDAETVRERAMGFLAHNRDRVAISPQQIHHSAIQAGDAEALEIDRVCKDAGVTVLRNPPTSGKFKTGDTLALGAIRSMVRKFGAPATTAVLRCLVLAGRAPVRSDEMKALLDVVQSTKSPDDVVAMLKRTSYDDAIAEAHQMMADAGLKKSEALSAVYARALLTYREVVAA